MVEWCTGRRRWSSAKWKNCLVEPQARLEVAIGGAHPRDRWRSLGWSVIDSHSISVTPADYRGYIQRSRGEFSVAKNVYVATGSGWFSCRTVCYLAAGRPAVVQDTGFSEFLPTGRGLFAFSDIDSAGAGIAAVEADYPAHQEAAREIARRYFAWDLVLKDLLKRSGLG
jgi:glycosyltransferase involved in cell wall biosynthesis